MIIKSYFLPHPPLIIEGIGKKEEILKTKKSYQLVAKEINRLKPDCVVIFTPHFPINDENFNIVYDEYIIGNMLQFKSERKVKVKNDLELVDQIYNGVINSGVKIKKLTNISIDHASFIPLHFVKCKSAIVISNAFAPAAQHYKFGEVLNNLFTAINKKIVVIASGDTSHKLKKNGTYGLSQEGVKFDQILIDAIKNNNHSELINLNNDFINNAGQCGLFSLITMFGVISSFLIKSKIYSYEYPYGVGYLAASFSLEEPTKNKILVKQIIKLAKDSVENYLKHSKNISPSKELSSYLLNNRFGSFVCLKKNKELRGCVGTILPTKENLATEIIANAISAAINDNRFNPVIISELDKIKYSVDVLTKPQVITNLNQLNPKKYGIIVQSGSKSGILLPSLEGINTIEQQINIACQKANILQTEKIIVYKFMTNRYE
ncbi:MAG: AmmeMemoRadiSam system protein A [Mycoplasmataceae bacterium]|jgi:AmmeMemoRadiSam system protein A|nr:AmmeMemoRadiSam system protein A [Mycoplasmataceae bacterium]